MNPKVYEAQQRYYKRNPQRRKAMHNYSKFSMMFRNLIRIKRNEKHPLIGCPLMQFMDYLEEQFQPGMTWENYGKIWQIDHIDPVSMFDLTREDQIQLCWHYTNLRPILTKENRKKHNGLVLRH